MFVQFQSTPARSRRHTRQEFMGLIHRFQSTPARSRRLAGETYQLVKGKFQSTPARSRRLACASENPQNLQFQSTPARSRRRGQAEDRGVYWYFNPLQREAGDGNYYQFSSIFYTFPYTNQPIFYILHPIPPPIPLSQCAFSSANPLRN